jgi:hypothetical protein
MQKPKFQDPKFGRYGIDIEDHGGNREVHDYKIIGIRGSFNIFIDRLKEYGSIDLDHLLKLLWDPNGIRILWDIHCHLHEDKTLKDILLKCLQGDCGLKRMLGDPRYEQYFDFFNKGTGGNYFFDKPKDRKKLKNWQDRAKHDKFIDYMIDWQSVAESIVENIKSYDEMIKQYETIRKKNFPAIFYDCNQPFSGWKLLSDIVKDFDSFKLAVIEIQKKLNELNKKDPGQNDARHNKRLTERLRDGQFRYWVLYAYKDGEQLHAPFKGAKAQIDIAVNEKWYRDNFPQFIE